MSKGTSRLATLLSIMAMSDALGGPWAGLERPEPKDRYCMECGNELELEGLFCSTRCKDEYRESVEKRVQDGLAERKLDKAIRKKEYLDKQIKKGE
jgi:hypothetical protein